MPGLVLQMRQRRQRDIIGSDATEAAPGDRAAAVAVTDSEAIRVGFTTSRKVGGAVARNRARRRLRAIAERLLPLAGRPGCDYVVIGRPATPTRPFALLVADFETALARLNAGRGRGPRPDGAGRRTRRDGR